MIEFEKPNIECVETDDKRNYAKFICEPLERGYGMTIGNSLRRILLSSLPGAAITSVKIDGVVHEFSTIPGVVEDVPELIVNLKSVRIRVHDNDEKIIRIDHKGAVEKGSVVPEWLELDAKKLSAKVLRPVNREEIDVPVEEHLIVELYSK